MTKKLSLETSQFLAFVWGDKLSLFSFWQHFSFPTSSIDIEIDYWHVLHLYQMLVIASLFGSDDYVGIIIVCYRSLRRGEVCIIYLSGLFASASSNTVALDEWIVPFYVGRHFPPVDQTCIFLILFGLLFKLIRGWICQRKDSYGHQSLDNFFGPFYSLSRLLFFKGPFFFPGGHLAILEPYFHRRLDCESL